MTGSADADGASDGATDDGDDGATDAGADADGDGVPPLHAATSPDEQNDERRADTR